MINRHKNLRHGLLTACALLAVGPAFAQPNETLHVIKSAINSDGDSASLCLEFDHALASTVVSHLSLHMETDGKIFTPNHIVATDASLCLFPLEHGKDYRLKLSGLQGSNGENLEAPYQKDITVSNKMPSLSFNTPHDQGGMGDFNKPLNLRSVNITHVKLSLYRISDPDSMRDAWQARKQAALAPSESLYLARNKGTVVWNNEQTMVAAKNQTSDIGLSLSEKLHDAAPGLYLLAAESEDQKNDPANKPLSPLTATWVTKSNFTLRALRDGDSVRVIATSKDATAVSGLRILPIGDKNGKTESKTDHEGLATLQSDSTSVMGIDAVGNIAFADTENPPHAPVATELKTPSIQRPHLEIEASATALTNDAPITIHAVGDRNAPLPLTGGHVSLRWQKEDPAILGWGDYHFGCGHPLPESDAWQGDFLTDPQGQSQIKLNELKPPPEHGLYQAILNAVPDGDAPIEAAQPVALSVHPDNGSVGIKALAQDARFMQNGLARFSLIALSADGKARDMQGLTFQISEEGRSFAWYQDNGRWQYKPEARLRPVGGGGVSIRADGSSIVEWPVSAGFYRLEIRDAGGKKLASLPFSASWDAAPVADNVAPLSIETPKNLAIGHEATLHFEMPQTGLITAIISDGAIRKIIHEARTKGYAAIAFTPQATWGSSVTIDLRADFAGQSPMRRLITLSVLHESVPAPHEHAEIDLQVNGSPEVLSLRHDQNVAMSFTLINHGSATDKFHYGFTAPGCKLAGDVNGVAELAAGETRKLTLRLTPQSKEAHELKLDVTGKTTHITQSWSLTVDAAQSLATKNESKQVSGKDALPAPGDDILFVARQPMSGLAELLSAFIKSEPFTTHELSLSADVWQRWGAVMTDAGLASNAMAAARRQELIDRLIHRQNNDGGFGMALNEESDWQNTADALLALGKENTPAGQTAAAKAVGWIKQHLANSWVDEKDRAPRAAGYAGLAVADAQDAASLHYYSDINAGLSLPAMAEAQIAAAFKQARDPNAAAFWIKKMLDEHGHSSDLDLMNALAATDALSSDDVHKAMADIVASLQKAGAADNAGLASLLRALSVDGYDSGKWRITKAAMRRDVSGVGVLRGHDGDGWRNDDNQPLYVTRVGPTIEHAHAADIQRRIYRLNGVELTPPAQPLSGEIYVVELRGVMPKHNDGQHILIQDGSNDLRPVGCPMSATLETQAFIPWLSPSALTPTSNCEFSEHALNFVLAPTEDTSPSFWSVYFAHIDAGSLKNIPTPTVRILW